MKPRAVAPLLLILLGHLGFALTSAVVDATQRGGRGNTDTQALAEPFRGVTTDGTVVAGLYDIAGTGVSTAPVRAAAEAFLATLTAGQRARTLYPVDDDEWRKWQNVHRYDRQGMSRRAMSAAQEQAAFDLLRASLSSAGYDKARNIMTLNGVLAELVDNHEEYGEDLYFFTVMGEPSAGEPWGWQLDGHHLVINFFVLGDQVVMTPTFMGSEPVHADSGPHAGLRVFGPEEARGLAMIRSLSPQQQEQAIIAEEPIGQVLTAAFRDNFELRYEGIPATDLTAAQRQTLRELVGEYVGNMDEGHAALRMDEIEAHLDDTWFAWMGGTDDDAVFYYRVHSPVLLLEFDHQGGIALNRGAGMTRNHIHTVVRTPNGNDYGKDLLRQHYEQFDHVNGVHVPHQLDRSILDDPARPAIERQRDLGSHPLEVYEFLGIGPGMAVADIMPFAGYNAHLLARVVAPAGRVVAPYAFRPDGVANLQQRFERAGIDNAEPMFNLDGVADASLDVVLTVRNVHDWYIPAIEQQFGFERTEILASIMRTLKPGGILGVVDARTPEEGINDQTHRINEEFAIAELQAAGFELVARSDILAVPDDDYTEMGFPTRWNEDRMLLKFRKPAAVR